MHCEVVSVGELQARLVYAWKCEAAQARNKSGEVTSFNLTGQHRHTYVVTILEYDWS